MKAMQIGTSMNRFMAFVVFVLFAPMVLFAETPKKAEDPYAVVASAKLFAIGGVGFAGTSTDAELSLREIVKRKDGAQLCGKLLQEKNQIARLYGLLGLKMLDAKAFDAAYPKLEASRLKVMTASGCELYEDTVARLAKEIRDSKVR
jgi:hypothetical protein